MVDSVDWDQVRPMSMPAFLERFTLHDSCFEGLSISDDRIVVSLAFDLVWNRAVPEGYDNLLFQFDRPYRVQWGRGLWDLNVLVGAESSVLDAAARADLISQGKFYVRTHAGPGIDTPFQATDETLTRTRFEFTNGAVLEILHGAAVRCLVADADSRTIDVSTIANAAT